MECSDRVISKTFNKKIQNIGGGKKVDTVGPECLRKCMVPVTRSKRGMLPSRASGFG